MASVSELRSPLRIDGDPPRPASAVTVRDGTDRPMTGGAVRAGLSRAWVTLAGAATMVAVAHLLGASRLGAFAAAQTLLSILLVVTTLGFEHGIVYYVSSGRWSAANAFRSSQQVALGFGLFGAAGGLAARLLVPQAFHGLSVAVCAAAAAALPFALSWLYGAYVALAVDHYEGFAWPWAVQAALALCLVIVGSWIWGVAGAVAGLALAHAVTSALGVIGGRRLVGSRHDAGERAGRQLRRALRFGIKGYGANSLQAVNYRLDLLILNATVAGAAVGHYAVAVAVTGVIWLLPQALADVLFPRVASIRGRSGGNDTEGLRFAEGKVLRHTVLATVAVSLGVVAGLLWLVRPIFGAGFHASVDLGLILLPGVMLLAIANPLAAAVVARGRPGLMLAAALVMTPLTIAMYFTLIPALHSTGAALASSISYAGMFCLAAACYRLAGGAPGLALMIPGRSELDDYKALARRLIGSRGPARHATVPGT